MNLRLYLIAIKLQMIVCSAQEWNTDFLMRGIPVAINQLSPLLLVIFLLCLYAAVPNPQIASYAKFQNISHFVEIFRTTTL